MYVSIEKLYEIFCQHPHICTDTREIKPGSIFFALKGANFNGNLFAGQALEKGCSFAVIDEDINQKEERFLIVPNVLKALQDLASLHRDVLNLPLLAVTGSNGKTTTKELTNAVLSQKYNVLATKGNLNNHIGVPLTLLSLTKDHEIAIVEMGANHIGEIAQLCEIAKPNYGLITNIGKAHLEGFGGQEGVINAKSELYKYISECRGSLFVNLDNTLLAGLSSGIKRITYGTSEEADVNGKLLGADPFVKFQWAKGKKIIESKPTVQTQIPGKYNFENIMAAVCIGNFFNVEEAKIKEALESYIPSNNRSQVIKKGSNIILLDAYNANPTSVRAAIENLCEMQATNKMLILGDMLELGNQSLQEHRYIIQEVKEKKINKVLLVGRQFSEIKNETNLPTFQKAEDAREWLMQHPVKDSTILIKGSRGIKLEQLLDALPN